ncbi:14 kDa subunit of cytochrome bd ubiquinol oxidase [Schizophyllum commune H4-8]|uniref:Cytochrome b-c1 complex subunit 7 n=1 Tax=Schizophyllum commune (strain H4-8 / FGSC 9210) TaxID=578458 RepID=D8PWE7_SCHCM|nr:14 kDa subunit of cytochrome bd ubiquinol oxidase [Schizophyllum commune H4-8]KAI5899980.1 14 kDa subunit of cytochrome bd ubiquinol oxidase [Schizophyllum commune H4-8]
MIFGPTSLSLAPRIAQSKSLLAYFKPIAAWYTDLMGYRKYGLKYDDLILEENKDMFRAINRLPERELYDRGFRFKRASQASIMHAPLSKEQWTKPEEDTQYLRPHIDSVVEENKERQYWDNLKVERK